MDILSQRGKRSESKERVAATTIYCSICGLVNEDDIGFFIVVS